MTRVAALLVAAGILAAVTVGPAGPASAHPLGVPQTLHLSADGSRVTARWSAAPNDLTALGLQVGALGAPRQFVYDRGVLVPDESDPADAAVLAESDELKGYLLDRIRVHQGRSSCRGSVGSTTDLLGRVARLDFNCPDEVDRVRVVVTTLTDVHPDYRTAAASGSGQRAIYTDERPAHTWALGEDSRQAGPFGPSPRLVLAVPVALAAAWLGVFLVRRRHRDVPDVLRTHGQVTAP